MVGHNMLVGGAEVLGRCSKAMRADLLLQAEVQQMSKKKLGMRSRHGAQEHAGTQSGRSIRGHNPKLGGTFRRFRQIK